MNCNLDIYETYPVTKIVHDEADSGYMLTLLSAPKTCPDGKFLTHKAEIIVDAKAAPSFTYRKLDATIVVKVPSREFIEEHNPVPTSLTVGWWLGACLLVGFGAWIIYSIVKWFDDRAIRKEEERLDEEACVAPSESGYWKNKGRCIHDDPADTVVREAPHGGSAMDSFVGSFAGSSLANAMNGGGSRHEDLRERPSSFSTPEPERETFKSEPDRSFLSDVADAFSSDSGSSFSSDSGSSFGSDSGSSFGSD